DSRCQTKSAPSKSAAPRAHESQRREDDGLTTALGAVTPVGPVSPPSGCVSVIRPTGAWGGGDAVESREGMEGRLEGVSKGGRTSSSASAASCARSSTDGVRSAGSLAKARTKKASRAGGKDGSCSLGGRA